MQQLEDENAFGLLVAYHDLENAEYSLEPAEFTARFTEFRELSLQYAAASPLGTGASVLDLGHALYFEVGDGDQATDPFAWLRGLRTELSEHDFQVAAVLTHGGRWGGAALDIDEYPAGGGT